LAEYGGARRVGRRSCRRRAPRRGGSSRARRSRRKADRRAPPWKAAATGRRRGFLCKTALPADRSFQYRRRSLFFLRFLGGAPERLVEERSGRVKGDLPGRPGRAGAAWQTFEPGIFLRVDGMQRQPLALVLDPGGLSTVQKRATD